MLDLDLRFYKRYDADLIALHKAGVPIGEYIKQALDAYVTGKPFHIYVPFTLEHDFNDRQLLHTQVRIDDMNTEIMLAQIKRGFRNSFCKLLLRNALIYQNLGIYHTRPEYREIEQRRISCSDMKKLPGTIVAEKVTAEPVDLQAKYLKKAVKKPVRQKRSAPVNNPVKEVEEEPVPVIVQIPAKKAAGGSDDQQALLSIFKNMVDNT